MSEAEIIQPIRQILDDIDRRVTNEVLPGYFESRVRLIVGMWEKGEAIALVFRGVESRPSYCELERITGRDDGALKKWHSLYEKYPAKDLFIEKYARPRAEKWAVKAVGAKELPSLPDRISGETACTQDLHALVSKGYKFGTIYADPPWLYRNQGTRAATSNHYDGLTVDELCELPIKDLAKDDSFLHLWTTNAFLFECPKIMEAWGFEYRSVFVWAKPQMGIGNYWRVSHEFLLLARRGGAKWLDPGLMSWAAIDRTKHSEKPEKVRQMIERGCNGPYLELFGRKPATGWVVWGNEITKNMFEESIVNVG